MIYKSDPQLIAPYLKDASNYSNGFAEKIIVPEKLDEFVEFMECNKLPITIAGAGTGMTGSRIPNSGLVVSLELFNDIILFDEGFIDVGPSVSLKELNDYLDLNSYMYPPNPTESLASIGGMVSTNASGSRSYKYGVTRDYVIEADLIFPNGKTILLKRGLKISEPLKFSDGQKIKFPDIKYRSPCTKNAAGYYIAPNMDWLDLFIGSDGTLCVFTRIRLKLIPSPATFISGVLFFRSEEECWSLVDLIKKSNNNLIDPCSLEYFDQRSLNRLRSKFDNIPLKAKAALFFENAIEKQADYAISLNAWFDFLTRKSVLLDESWFSQSPKDTKRFHEFRHAIPVLVNEENSRLGRVKIGTDMAVSDAYFFEMLNYYKDELELSKIDFVIFGHLGDNHLHINLFPDDNQLQKAQTLYNKLVTQVLKWNGTVSAEHGIGKLKKNYFLQMVGDSSINELKTIKKLFDPLLILGKGNIFD